LDLGKNVELVGEFSANRVDSVIVISTVRIIYVYSMISDPDSTYNVAKACIFSTVELNGGVICACVALLKPFIQRYMPWILSLSSGSGSGSGSRSKFRKLRIFAKRSGEKSYELQSADADGGPDAVKQASDSKSDRQIAVTRSYSVQGSKTGKSDGDSMEDLFAPNSGWNGGR
jgi:hypothetical protein